MLPQIALKSGAFITKILKNQGFYQCFEVSKSTRVVPKHTRGNTPGIIESDPKAACAKCCLKSLCNPMFSSLKP
jgi:hypothetical protein